MFVKIMCNNITNVIGISTWLQQWAYVYISRYIVTNWMSCSTICQSPWD